MSSCAESGVMALTEAHSDNERMVRAAFRGGDAERLAGMHGHGHRSRLLQVMCRREGEADAGRSGRGTSPVWPACRC